MEHQQIVVLLILAAASVILALIAYYNGRHDGERRGAIKAAIFADKVLELEDELRREHDASEQLELSVEYERSQLRRLRVEAEWGAAELEESRLTLRQLYDENQRLEARLGAELGQVDDLAQALVAQAEAHASTKRLAADALELVVEQLNRAEARALLPADVQHLQHAARQLGQHAAQFRRTGSQKVNHAQVAADHLLQLIQRVQPAAQQSEESSPRRAA